MLECTGDHGDAPAVLACSSITKSYFQGPEQLCVLNAVTLSLCAADSLAIVGTSGSGKTTLLHLLAGLDTVSAGDVCWGNQSINGLSAQAL
ncbi:MAG: ATP-binding cassette domain-containing protein, partial [Gammaproteobacteria bacterium]